ncbi:putative disease resistance protein RGA4 [Morella rubra]|uniref:Putative disease resistance protein RGA4 n=1 Tax=Morella rubra TaxID=262757 RepID=A0A6A1WAM0_9ROSI|nr:putative disease resistance protein RGA4 [Morella rubra]
MIKSCEELYLSKGEEHPDVKFSLQGLVFSNLPQLEVLPRWLQGSANTLKELVIKDCQNFEVLPEWLPNLKSIQKLAIINCPKLSSLLEGMQHLTALSELWIRDCDELSRKCKQEDWSKIAHIPPVVLDEESGND